MIVILNYQSVLTWQQPAIKTLNEVSAACCEMCAIQTSYNGAPSPTFLTLCVRECA